MGRPETKKRLHCGCREYCSPTNKILNCCRCLSESAGTATLILGSHPTGSFSLAPAAGVPESRYLWTSADGRHRDLEQRCWWLYSRPAIDQRTPAAKFVATLAVASRLHQVRRGLLLRDDRDLTSISISPGAAPHGRGRSDRQGLRLLWTGSRLHLHRPALRRSRPR